LPTPRLPIALTGLTGLAVLLAGCKSPGLHVEEADEETYQILEAATADVTGEAKTFDIGRKSDTLRQRLLTRTDGGGPVRLDIVTALDVAAENSRDFARQKEALFRSALNLTRLQNEFSVQWSGGGAGRVSGTSDDSAQVSFQEDLSASVRSTSGARILAGFASGFFRSLISSDGWNGSSALNLSLTQPLLEGFGEIVTREPLTQAERDVVYSVRSFERFRNTFAVDIISSYFSVLQDMQNLESVRRNYESLRKNREQIEAFYEAGRRAINDVDRAQQSELSAQNNIVNAENRLQSSLDSFKLDLGLPTDAEIELDMAAFENLEDLGILPVDVSTTRATELALQRRFDYRNTLDQVEDAARQVVITENTLMSVLDFSTAVSVPTESGQPLDFDWSQVNWSAGFDLDLALNRLPQRNSYRQSLINLNNAIRSREESEDRIKQQIRNSLRNITTRVANYEIQTLALELAERRVDSTQELYTAARVQALEVLDAQDSLLQARIQLTGALVDYAIARLQLLRDLEGVSLEPKGLRIDLSLPLPTGPQATQDAERAADTARGLSDPDLFVPDTSPRDVDSDA
jgi:outer membrane protein TolC